MKTTSTNPRNTSSRQLWLWLLAAGGLCVTALSVRETGELPRYLPEIDRTFLTQTAGRLHRVGHAAVFEGWMIERRADGSLKSRSRVSSGVLHGVSEGWNNTGGLEVREHFVLGVSHGVRTKWHANGQKLSEASIVQGKIEGIFRRWHDNGVLAEEIQMQAGRAEGLSRAWHSSGCLKAEVQLTQGQVKEKQYWEDGVMPYAIHLTATTR